MAQSSYALMTNVGLAREAAAQSGGTQIVITHIAVGDGATVPSGGETALYNELTRKTISGQGIVSGQSNVAYADIYLGPNDGPYTIRELGLIDSTGALIAIGRLDPPINKTAPVNGATSEGTIRMEVAFSNTANVNIVVDLSMAVALQRLTVLPWIPVISLTLNAPPASPAVGDTYVIGPSPTGVWSGNASKVTEYTTAGWAMITPKNGHGVGLPDGRTFIRVGGVYVDTASLFKEPYVLAAGSANALAVTPAPAFSGYAVGQAMSVKIAATNTGPATLNVNGLGAKTLVVNGGTFLTGGELVAGDVVRVVYDGASFNVLNPSATMASRGLVEIATSLEHLTGTDTSRAVSPATSWDLKRSHDYQAPGGTANAWTIALSPAPSAYRQGMVVFLSPVASNTGPVTLNINGLGLREIRGPRADALSGGEIQPTQQIMAVYNSAGFFVVLNASASVANLGLVELATLAEVVTGTDTTRAVTPAGLTAALQRGSAFRYPTPGSFNWVVPDGVTRVRAKVWGGGGGGGAGFPNGSGSQPGGGGAGGGYAERLCSVTPGQTIPITVGSGGASGVSGTVSSFGSYCAANGGGSGGAATSSSIGFGSGGGGTGVGTDSLTIQGNGGQNGIALNNGILGGCGGGTFQSSNTFNPAGNGRINGSFPGGGGSGGTIDGAGGVGGGDLVILESF